MIQVQIQTPDRFHSLVWATDRETLIATERVMRANPDQEFSINIVGSCTPANGARYLAYLRGVAAEMRIDELLAREMVEIDLYAAAKYPRKKPL